MRIKYIEERLRIFDTGRASVTDFFFFYDRDTRNPAKSSRSGQTIVKKKKKKKQLAVDAFNRLVKIRRTRSLRV